MADLDVLIKNFRLLELAGAAEQIAHQGEESPEALLWLAYAKSRTELSLLDFDWTFRQLRASCNLRPWSRCQSWKEVLRGHHIRNCVVDSRTVLWGSYLHFLGACEAMANLEGELMAVNLRL